MAALPSAQDLGITLPQADRPIVSYRGGIAQEGQIAEAQGLSKLGGDIAQGAGAILAVHDKIATDDAMVKFQNATFNRLYGDPNVKGDVGYYGTKGADALNGRAPVLAGLEADRQAIMSGLGSDYQKHEFNTASRRLYAIEQEKAGSHAIQQANVYGQSVQVAAQDTALRQASLSGGDDAMFQASLTQGQMAARNHALLAGKAPEAAEAAAVDYTGRAYQVRALAIATTNPVAALNFAKAHQKELGESAPALFAHLEPKADQFAADGIANQTLVKPNAGGALDPGTVGRARLVFDGLVARGMDVHKALAFAANGVAESGADHTRAENNGGPGRGLFQLTSPSRKADFQKTFGHPVEQGTLDEQLDFAVHELGTSEAPANAGIDDAQGAAAKAAAVSRLFERPADVAGQQRVRAGHAATLGAMWGIDVGDPSGGPDRRPPVPLAPILDQARAAAAAQYPGNPRIQHLAVQTVEQRLRVSEIDRERAQAFQQKQIADQSHEAMGRVIADATGSGQNPDITAAQIGDPNGPYAKLTESDRRSAIAFVAATGRRADHDSATYGTGFNALFQQIHTPDGTPPEQKISNVAQLVPHVGPGGDLTLAGFRQLQQELDSRKTVEGATEGQMKRGFFDGAHVTISGHGLGAFGSGKDPVGETLFGQFQVAALTAYAEGRKANKTPQQLLTAKSPDYIGNILPQFLRTPQQRMADAFAANAADSATAAPLPAAAAAQGTLDLTTSTGIAAAYRAGHFGVGPEAHARAAAELVRRGFAAPDPAPAAVGAPR